MSYALDEILTLKEVTQALRLDPRTVKEVAFALGGRRIGYRWRFRWGTVLEYFSNADVETRQRKLLVIVAKSVDGPLEAGGPCRQQGGGRRGYLTRR